MTEKEYVIICNLAHLKDAKSALREVMGGEQYAVDMGSLQTAHNMIAEMLGEIYSMELIYGEQK